MTKDYSNFKPQWDHDPKKAEVIDARNMGVDAVAVASAKKIYKTRVVKVKHLYVRDKPTKQDSYRMQILSKGYNVTVLMDGLGIKGEWSEIKNPLNKKVKAYVMTKHIS